MGDKTIVEYPFLSIFIHSEIQHPQCKKYAEDLQVMGIKYIKCRLNDRQKTHKEAESQKIFCCLQPFFPCTTSIHIALAVMKCVCGELEVLNRFDFWEAEGDQTLAHNFLGEQGALL